MRRKLPSFVLVVLVALATAGVATAGNGGFAPITPHSPNASRINDAYWVVFGFAAFVFLLVESLLVAFVWKYRSRGRSRAVEGAQVHGHTRLELMWTVFPVLILAVIAAAGIPIGAALAAADGRRLAGPGWFGTAIKLGLLAPLIPGGLIAAAFLVIAASGATVTGLPGAAVGGLEIAAIALIYAEVLGAPVAVPV